VEPALALAVDADGVHLGQKDLPYAIARKLFGPGRIIGRIIQANAPEITRAGAHGLCAISPVVIKPGVQAKVGKFPALFPQGVRPPRL
jgi:thiamine-phosphate pyrophosphorylase